HFGVDTTYNKIADRYYWKGMYDDIRRYVKSCDICQRRGQKGGKSYLNPIEVGEPFERIGIDFIGPLERTKRRNRYILVVTDYLTKWSEAKAMKEATAENVVKFIYERIICDIYLTVLNQVIIYILIRYCTLFNSLQNHL